jgi:hypothetical protein
MAPANGRKIQRSSVTQTFANLTRVYLNPENAIASSLLLLADVISVFSAIGFAISVYSLRAPAKAPAPRKGMLAFLVVISWINWSLSNKDESSSLLKPGASLGGPWEDAELTASGAYVRSLLRTGPTTRTHP